MISLMSNLLVFSAACLLALPAGWCCIPSTEVEELAAKPCPACASHGESTHSDSDSRPNVPDGTCKCCDMLTTLVMAVAKVDLLAASALPIALVDLPAAPLAQAALAESRIIDPGPPLRILQCVMRC